MVEFVSIAAWVKKQKKNQDQIVRKVVLDVDRSLQRRSPVDTGRFKTNWQLGVDFKPTGYNYQSSSNTKLGMIDDSVIGLHAGSIPVQSGGHVYWLVNNLPYANALEDGHSKQAPAPWGIVNITLIKFEGIVDRAMSTLK